MKDFMRHEIFSLHIIRHVLLLVFFAIFTANIINSQTIEKQPANSPFEFYVLQAGWHTGIVLRTDEVSPVDWPEILNYRRSRYVDVGFGDERFYQATGNPPALAARALLVPTSGVLHIVPFSVAPKDLYTGDTHLKKMEATPRQFAALCRVISESFERDENRQPVESRIGEKSRNFFLAKEKYHLFNTCNTWVVRCLMEAGFDADPSGVITQKQLIRALEDLPGGKFSKYTD
jgi:uncharacterized protein (TIGR02117 family)